jgi:WD40 repeat protein
MVPSSGFPQIDPNYYLSQVVIWDDAKQKVVITLPVFTTVRSVRFSRSHIVVALQNSIRVYHFKTKPDLWHAFETADNPLGLCCLTAKTLAFPGRTPGQVQLVELATGNVSIIPAHGSALRAIDISRDGEVLATASETVC